MTCHNTVICQGQSVATDFMPQICREMAKLYNIMYNVEYILLWIYIQNIQAMNIIRFVYFTSEMTIRKVSNMCCMLEFKPVKKLVS